MGGVKCRCPTCGASAWDILDHVGELYFEADEDDVKNLRQRAEAAERVVGAVISGRSVQRRYAMLKEWIRELETGAVTYPTHADWLYAVDNALAAYDKEQSDA